MVGRDRRARRAVRSAKSYRMNDHVGYVSKTKSSSLQSVVSGTAKTSFAIRELLAAFLIQSNSEIKTMFGTRTWSA